jgi:hypothetical protein
VNAAWAAFAASSDSTDVAKVRRRGVA